MNKKLSSLIGIPLSLGLFPRAVFRPPTTQRITPSNPLSCVPFLPSSFSLLSWNIQFCGSRKYHFFYDGGPDVHVSKQDVEETMNNIGEFLHAQKPDIIALQEVDRNSKRTKYIDQEQGIRGFLHNYSIAKATYFRSPFIPLPLKDPMGRVHTDLCTLSTAQTKKSIRHQLALLAESKIRQSFNLKRAILETEYKTSRGPLFVANTHLSAFSYGDGTLHKQVKEIEEWIQKRPVHARWIVAGDFNLLPLGDKPERLLTPGHYNHPEKNPLKKLLPKYKAVFSDALEHRSYMPFSHQNPDRKIDYILYSDGLHADESCVHSDVHLSDHLPLSVRFSIVD
jgi:endonuclease/exonuclease/phosphatase family metal-dependent hydrolase